VEATGEVRHTGRVSNPYQSPASPDPASGPSPHGQWGPEDPHGPSSGWAGHQAQPYHRAYPGPAGDHPQGLLILILGIAGLVFAGVLSPVAWLLGNRALRDIEATGYHPGNESMIVVGRLLGIIGTVLLVLVVVLVVLAVILFVTAAVSLG